MRIRRLKDILSGWVMWLLAGAAALIVFLMAIGL